MYTYIQYEWDINAGQVHSDHMIAVMTGKLQTGKEMGLSQCILFHRNTRDDNWLWEPHPKNRRWTGLLSVFRLLYLSN